MIDIDGYSVIVSCADLEEANVIWHFYSFWLIGRRGGAGGASQLSLAVVSPAVYRSGRIEG
ncbi:hypothetical protein DKK75_01995 [Bifidobacterium asteroides]|uniref:Uncharacterized protein n=1 Tax=Bifidobacterium asteroides TaxID=1684 RepID=A0A318MD19_9BIFI|nr:hypothetical protein DKK75_01995 [Bifidobacterium asteroides]